MAKKKEAAALLAPTPDINITINNNSDDRKAKAGGGLMSPREGYGVGSLATKGVMKALKQRAKSKTDPKIDRVEDPIDPSLLKKIEDFEPDTTTSKINEDKPKSLLTSRAEAAEYIPDSLTKEELKGEIEEEVLETLFRSDSTESATNRWNKFNILLRKNLNETDLGPEEFLQAIRKGSNRYLYESDSEYYDAVQNKLTDDAVEMEEDFFDMVMAEINKTDQGKINKHLVNLGGMTPEEEVEEGVFEALMMRDSTATLPEDRWIFIDRVFAKHKIYPDDTERAIREGVRRFLYETDAEYYDAVQNRLDDDVQDIEDNLFENVIDEISGEQRGGMQEGGEMAMPSEYTEDIPVDTYPNMTPEEEAMPVASDEQMQEDYVDYVTAEVLTPDEQDYLNAALDNDPQLEGILDKVVTYATEFTGEGEVEGPGTGISDSIPARLSDGEFVITEKATDEIGADNLQTMMDEAERAADGGKVAYALGGAVGNPMLGGAVKPLTPETPLANEKVSMYGNLRQQEEMKKQMMYANRMPSIIGR